MRKSWQFVGTIVFFCAWPVFWVYFKVGPGRTRVVLVHEGRVLVMKQWISPGKWLLPGGGLHRGEDIVEGASRELLEETGVRMDARQLLSVGRARYRKHGHTFEYEVFVAKVASSAVHAQRIEVSELVWLRPEHLTSQNSSPDTLDSLKLVRKKTTLL